MKSTQELFELVAKAVEQNKRECNPHWFITYSGHVNNMSVKFYRCGWTTDAHYESNDEYLTEDGIQSLYWFIKTRLY